MSQYQTFWKRFFSGIIDSLFFLPITYADHYIDVSNKYAFTFWIFLNAISWLIYSIYLHGKFGQTFGKRILGLKVLDIDEVNFIGYKRAFLRELIWTAVYFASIVYLIMISWNTSIIDGQLEEKYDNFFAIIVCVWLLLELLTVMINSKRRALHDFIANTVVIKLNKNPLRTDA